MKKKVNTTDNKTIMKITDTDNGRHLLTTKRAQPQFSQEKHIPNRATYP